MEAEPVAGAGVIGSSQQLLGQLWSPGAPGIQISQISQISAGADPWVGAKLRRPPVESD